jgi:flavin reductase (DIM6/NTAB) family NADH-FMN oxidoreductase RutF
VSSIGDEFKQVLSRWASGVSVVTTNADGMLYGLTVSSFSSLSLDPPLVLVCLSNDNRLSVMIGESGQFAVSILSRGQQQASNYFARSGRMPTPDFVEIEGEWTKAGQPVIKDALAWLVCDLHQAIVQGDHTIVIGRVVETHTSDDAEPLLYFNRSYRTLASTD